MGHWDIIGTLHWDMGHWTMEDIGTLGHGTLGILKYTLSCHTTHTHHTHTCSRSAFHTCPQPQPTPLPYGVCWRLALLSLQCVCTAPPPLGRVGSGWSAPNVCPSHPHCTLSPVPPSTGHLLLPSTLRTTTPRATMLVAAAPSS